jgi:hypothetical protein
MCPFGSCTWVAACPPWWCAGFWKFGYASEFATPVVWLASWLLPPRSCLRNRCWSLRPKNAARSTLGKPISNPGLQNRVLGPIWLTIFGGWIFLEIWAPKGSLYYGSIWGRCLDDIILYDNILCNIKYSQDGSMYPRSVFRWYYTILYYTLLYYIIVCSIKYSQDGGMYLRSVFRWYYIILYYII